MNDDIEIDDLYQVAKNDGVVEQVKAAYQTSVEDDEVMITLGTESGKVSENAFGEDDHLYAVDGSGEFPVPVSSAASAREVAESVLDRYAETNDGTQWAVSELD